MLKPFVSIVPVSTMAAFAVAAAIGGGALAQSPAPALPAGHVIYVRPDGNDGASGLSAGQAVRTLEHARDLARALPAPRAVQMSGHFMVSTPLMLGAQDSGISWLGDASTLLDGGGRANAVIVGRGLTHVRFAGFGVANTTADGIHLASPTNVAFEGLRLRNIMSTKWSQAAINVDGDVNDLAVLHNRIENTNYVGVLVFGGPQNTLQHVRMMGNTVLHSCKVVSDCGGLYINGRGRDSDLTIANNTVIDFGPDSAQGRGIYLDDWASNVTVTGNCVAGPGVYAIQIHGGDHNRITGNRIDASRLKAVLYNQPVDAAPTRSMAGNVFSGNSIALPWMTRMVNYAQSRAEQHPAMENNNTSAQVSCSAP